MLLLAPVARLEISFSLDLVSVCADRNGLKVTRSFCPNCRASPVFREEVRVRVRSVSASCSFFSWFSLRFGFSQYSSLRVAPTR